MNNYFVIYTGYVILLSILMGISTWKLFKKMGYNPLLSFVPFYNYYIILKETENPKWWSILSYFPIVGPIMMSVFHIFLMGKFGKKDALSRVLTAVLPFIYMATVNYSSKTELESDKTEFVLPGEEIEKKKGESFFGSVTFAVVFATLIHTFVTQPFGIPTGSMERTLLVGDFLFVNKLNYGYRMPMRPLAIPFLQGTIKDMGIKGNPKDDPKSYVEAVDLPYFRFPGWEKPEKNDIVVFNYPQDSVHISIDRKDPYVKRCVAVGGDVLEIKGGRIFVNGKPEQILGDQEMQHAYTVVTKEQLDIKRLYKIYGFLPVREFQTATGFEYLFQGLTANLVKEFKTFPEVVSVTESVEKQGEGVLSFFPEKEGNDYRRGADGNVIFSKKLDTTNSIFPLGKPWNQDWYGPIRIPKKGDVVSLTKETLPEYRWIISKYEHNKLEEKNGKIFVNGQETSSYTVKQNYYMMIGDNRDASLDARFFGFVPEEYIIGKPMFTWLSLEGVFPDSYSDYQPDFKIRWDRMFKATNTGEADKTSYWWIAAFVLILFFGWEYFVKLFKGKKQEEK